MKLAANYVESLNKVSAGAFPSRELVFAGDGVRLSGQLDYPDAPLPINGYPVMVILHHAGGHTRNDYAHYASIALQAGYAVFLWDKRGTGRSGASGCGSAVQDAVNAYETALNQPYIDARRALILAQGEGTLLLSEAFSLFEAVQAPMGALLIGSLLTPEQVLAIKTRIQIILGARDWIDWQKYGRAACEAHDRAYTFGAGYSVAHHADRLLMDTRKPGQRFHVGAKQIIKDWLKTLGEF